MVGFPLPRLYAIADAGLLASRALPLPAFAASLREAGVTLIQWRDKQSSAASILASATLLRGIFPPEETLLLLNDHPALAAQSHCDGVHLGQDDLAPAAARLLLPSPRLIGLSTHTLDQVVAASHTSADYLALGPIFATSSKPDASPVVGLDLLRRARGLTSKPIVAIGGITRHNAPSVLAAGADSLAVISALLPPHEPTANVVRDFLDLFR